MLNWKIRLERKFSILVKRAAWCVYMFAWSQSMNMLLRVLWNFQIIWDSYTLLIIFTSTFQSSSICHRFLMDLLGDIPVYQAISRTQRRELENKYCMKVKDWINTLLYMKLGFQLNLDSRNFATPPALNSHGSEGDGALWIGFQTLLDQMKVWSSYWG